MELEFEKTYPLELNVRYHFVIIGCGGNGGFLIRDLARQIAIVNKDLESTVSNDLMYASPSYHHITLIDADVVEFKNIRRQNFIKADIGSNKAEVLAKRYSQAYEIDIPYLAQYISDENVLADIGYMNNKDLMECVPVFVGCVDNNKTRALIAKTMTILDKAKKPAYWLDGGNEEYHGQIVLGAVGQRRKINKITEESEDNKYAFNIPNVTNVYKEILNADDKHPDELSCDDAAVSAPQCITTNILMAAFMMCFCNYFLSMPNGLETWMLSFNTRLINTSSKFTTISELSKYKY